MRRSFVSKYRCISEQSRIQIKRAKLLSWVGSAGSWVVNFQKKNGTVLCLYKFCNTSNHQLLNCTINFYANSWLEKVCEMNLKKYQKPSKLQNIRVSVTYFTCLLLRNCLNCLYRSETSEFLSKTYNCKGVHGLMISTSVCSYITQTISCYYPIP